MSEFARAQAGDPDLLAHLIRKHIPLVQSLCRRFSYCEDAFQQGCIGLLLAIRRFQEEKGCQFSTFAVPYILGEMRRAFSHTLGWRSRNSLKKAESYRAEQLLLTGREPSIQEMAAACQMAPEELILLMERNQPPVYDETGYLIASIPDPHSMDWLERFCIRDIFSRLPKNDQKLLFRRFIRGESQQKTSETMGISQSSLSRREKEARKRFIQAWNA